MPYGAATANGACGVKVGRRPDGLLLGSHERIVRVVFVSIPPCLTSRNELDVVFLSSADMSHCLLSKLDSSLAVLLDYITAYVRVALCSLYNDAIVAARVNDVLPDFGRAILGTTRTGDLDAISVATLDFIFDQMRLVVIDLDANLVQVERIAYNNRLDIKVSRYGGASTEIDGILLDARPTLFALYIDSIGIA